MEIPENSYPQKWEAYVANFRPKNMAFKWNLRPKNMTRTPRMQTWQVPPLLHWDVIRENLQLLQTSVNMLQQILQRPILKYLKLFSIKPHAWTPV